MDILSLIVDLNATVTGRVLLITGAWVALLGYVAPTLIACWRGHPRALAICALNLLMGFTGIGWLAALGWALSKR